MLTFIDTFYISPITDLPGPPAKSVLMHPFSIKQYCYQQNNLLHPFHQSTFGKAHKK